MQHFSPVKERILKYLDFKGVSKYQYYKDSGTTRGILDKESGLSEDSIAKFIAYSGDVNADWLLTGNGAMIKTGVAIPATVPGEGIPLIPLEAMAGFGNGENAVMELESERFIVPTFKGADYLIPVKGSSMYPKYSSGDIVACKKLPLTDLFFQWNKVYVLDTAQGPLIKRVKKSAIDKHILLVSENKEYDPIDLPVKSIYAVGIVMGVIRLE